MKPELDLYDPYGKGVKLSWWNLRIEITAGNELLITTHKGDLLKRLYLPDLDPTLNWEEEKGTEVGA